MKDTFFFSDYYKFEKIDNSRCGIDCMASTQGYMPFERYRCSKGERLLRLYLKPISFTNTDYDHKMRFELERNAVICPIYAPSSDTPNIMCGKVEGCDDCLIFILYNGNNSDSRLPSGLTIEIFVARMQSHQMEELAKGMAKGKFNREVEKLRKSAGVIEPLSDIPLPTLRDIGFDYDEFKDVCVAHVIERFGFVNLLNIFDDKRRKGELSKMQAYRLKMRLREVYVKYLSK